MKIQVSQSFGFGETPIQLTTNPEQKLNQISGEQGASLEANLWLPYAAREYRLSQNIRDYVLVPCPVMISSMPNTNGDSVDIEELLKFDTKMGMQAFKSLRGMPCYLEHDNRDITKAKGVILDVFLRPLKGFGNSKYWKIVALLAYDRTKDPLLVNSILTKETNAYSVGFYFQAYTCSICGVRVGKGGVSTPCSHTSPKKPTYDFQGKLVYRRCHDIKFFETSSVGSPAFVIAVGPHVKNLFDY